MTSVASGFQHRHVGKLACHEQPTQPSVCCIYHNQEVERSMWAYSNCPQHFTEIFHHEDICFTEICHLFVCPLSVSKLGSYLLWYEKVPCRLEDDQCCKAEMADPSLPVHRLPQVGHKVKIPACFIFQILNPCRHRYVHQDSKAEVGYVDCRDAVPFCQPQTCTYHEVFSRDRTAQIQRLFYRVWSAHAADASSVFGQSIFGKPCFWQSIVWQTERTENWKVMLLDIFRNFWSPTSYVNKSPINNMRRFLRREFQLMLTGGMRVTTNNCGP